MLIATVGLNHRTAPVMVREKLAFAGQNLEEALKQLQAHPAIQGCVILSTCNRTEIYASISETDEGLNTIRGFLAQWSGTDVSEIINMTYCHALYDAIRHLFRVSSGLDSMLLGETEILGQVRAAYLQACEHQTTNSILNTLFQQALAVGKRVRAETKIDHNAVSISYAAVELAKSRLGGNLSDRTALIIGAGQMSELAAKHLLANGISGIIVSNRSFQRAQALAEQVSGRAVHLNELSHYLVTADIIISSTAAPHCVIKAPEIRTLIEKRNGREIVMIDLAVPRDIETGVGRLNGVHLYDIDALETVVDQNLAERKKAAVQAERIINGELNDFMRWLGAQFVIPSISALKQWGEEIKNQELEQALNRLEPLSAHDKKVVCSMAHSIVNQILHVPITQLKGYALTNEGHLYTEVLQNLFQLEVPCRQSANPKPDSTGADTEDNTRFA